MAAAGRSAALLAKAADWAERAASAEARAEAGARAEEKAEEATGAAARSRRLRQRADRAPNDALVEDLVSAEEGWCRHKTELGRWAGSWGSGRS